MATNQQPAASNFVTETTNLSVATPDPNDPVEKEFKKLMEEDDAATDEVDAWIRDNKSFADAGGGTPTESFNAHIRARFAPIINDYEDFIKRHPDHARVRLAYGSFLDTIHDEEGSQKQWEKALELDPKNPAAWNNMANIYGEHGPVKKAFEYYAKAMELNPGEWRYYHNLGDVIYLFRKDAAEYYHIDEQQVFNKALDLYQKAMKLNPDDFELAQDVAQTYYGIKPFRADEGLAAWTNALKLASNELETEGVYIHLARFKMHAERFDQARAQLNSVTNEFYSDLKSLLLRNLEKQEADAKGTNAPAPPAGKKQLEAGKPPP